MVKDPSQPLAASALDRHCPYCNLSVAIGDQSVIQVRQPEGFKQYCMEHLSFLKELGVTKQDIVYVAGKIFKRPPTPEEIFHWKYTLAYQEWARSKKEDAKTEELMTRVELCANKYKIKICVAKCREWANILEKRSAQILKIQGVDSNHHYVPNLISFIWGKNELPLLLK